MKIYHLLLVYLFMGLGLSLTAIAEEASSASRVPLPTPPKAKASIPDTECVEPLEVMRRQHGHFLKHHRDKTMHEGIRTKQHSLIECINCHVTPSADAGHYPSIQSETHFCRNCHSYAAVNIDCFQCHASKPGDTVAIGMSAEREP